MSDKKEIATLSIKISVDSTDLDKLETQLKRIEGLMVSTGLKQPAQQGFTVDFGIFNPKGCLEPVFTNSADRVFINGVFIENGTIEKMVLQPAEEQTKKGAEQARFEITTGVNDNREQVSAEVPLKSSAKIAETSKAISREQSEFEKFKQKVESEFSQLHSSITAIQHTQANSEIASANAIEQVRAEIQRKEPLDL
ncbi:hypothetical protein O8Q80_003930 [Providencia rettgeri]|uniref:hypothetical protein n=1 Tax=Providencia rettgeri TaxID=587 RepID=UPI001D5A33FD|nr:hypothetical protein [Providencia rettgeri]EKH6498453.1 hypothetical protein [Providencia rettgeri]ELR5055142.1 hypothetical protein [Providencia rettgeri]ELR5157596.1 hypothetical protein [Providencia rettgeri]ELR5184377.1 hypothetical protein [Providencia rettgeri]ELR5276545.1 hypothetical protein [Providencia rettgeri]